MARVALRTGHRAEQASPTDEGAGEAVVESAARSSYELPDIENVRRAHFELMRAYTGALEAASHAGIAGRSPIGADSMETRFLVQLMVGSHIRNKLIQLGTGYLHLYHTFDAPDGNSHARWLGQAREGCLEMSAALPRVRLPGVFVLIPVITGLAVAFANLPGWVGLVFLVVAVVVGALSWLGYQSVRDSYRCKRALFLPDAETLEDNIYALEDELFLALRLEKRREIEIDRLVLHIGLVVLSLAFTALSFEAFDRGLLWLGVVGVVGVVITFGLAFISGGREGQRVWL